MTAPIIIEAGGFDNMASVAMPGQMSEKDLREYQRVHSGHMDGLERLMLFTPVVKQDEDNWSVLHVSVLEEIPYGVCAERKLSADERLQARTMAFRGSPFHWSSCIFARVEKGEKR